MADAFSGVSALADQVIAAYDRSALFALRAEAVFDQFARVKPGNQTSPGSSVSFLFWGDLTAVTTALSETVDVDAVALSDSLVTVTPAEYGNAVLLTIRVRKNSFVLGFDSDVANIVGYNQVDSLESIAEIAIRAGATTVTQDGGASASLTAGDVVTMNNIRAQVSALRNAKVRPWTGSSYAVVMNPDVSYDIMAGTGDGSWAAFHQRQNPTEFLIGEVGAAAGAILVESPRAYIDVDGGASAVDNYYSYFFGQESFAKAETIPPHIVPGPVTDKLMRFMPLGWHFYLGYKVLRATALRALISASSIGTNV